ncbi:MaoC family dehydratase N-terminal domain-containing protein [Aquibium sp. LZ166]|uniref:MaoC family dehydratase N-terminal domain-containing protein n=1 Tax=Aquibium pacificus TaxID=3153579 RepID=A0ABV3SIJ3_9HYPH
MDDYGQWIGRTETRRDIVVAGPLDRLAATLDRTDPPLKPGDQAPPLAHWLMFLPGEPQSALGPDGHARRGGFLPPVHELPRRMWAGSRLKFPGDLRVGMEVERRSLIADVKQKEGETGSLVFVTVRHEIGEPGGPALVIDEHDIVYRGLAGAAAKSAIAAPASGEWRREIVPDPVLLFRYSALTFNGHRIHYDREYTAHEEGYPGLVVHGPLIATLLLDLVRRERPGSRIDAFCFRAMAPLFDGRRMAVNGATPDAHGNVSLWAENAEGGLAMKAEARIG